MALISFGPRKFALDMGSSSNLGLIIAPGQKANVYDLGMSFQSYKLLVC